jgi:hypothetical protein
VKVVEGTIGLKLQSLHNLLRRAGRVPRTIEREFPVTRRPLYFLPDWDDFIDPLYDYVNDKFSSPNRADRKEKHTIAMMRPRRICDGVLVSLAQHLGSKGLLKRVELSDPNTLAPRAVKDHFGLNETQWAFGDCGAFSYVAEERPTVSVDQAVSLYDLYEFDLGASVDHIPVAALPSPAGAKPLSSYERRKRVLLTRDNAAEFISLRNQRHAKFIPVGIIQGLGPRSYANQVGDYLDMGYEHIALGGLVPRSDPDVKAIVQKVHDELQRHVKRPWIHLFGIFRPKLQLFFRSLGINSFDSATYFRKSWLRSDQNYLGADGQWYAAIRVPPLGDPRTLARLSASELSHQRLARLEDNALRQLRLYAKRRVSLATALQAVMEYDGLLARAELMDEKLLRAYQRTLANRPWEKCNCPLCQKLGIDILIFRGKNRNKSRGAHNTSQLFQMLREPNN